MKQSIALKLVIVVAALLCSALSVKSEKPTVLDALRCGNTFSTLKAAIKEAGMTGALTDPEASLTLFAPTNAAFAAFLDERSMTADELLQSSDLTDILKFHVVAGKKLSSSLQNGDTLSTLLGDTELEISTNGADIMINDATVVVDDIETGNGVVHIIDYVLFPTKVDDAEKVAKSLADNAIIVKDASEFPILG